MKMIARLGRLKAHVLGHFQAVREGKETFGRAAVAVGRETGETFAKSLKKGRSRDHKAAIAYAKKGTDAYNQRDYATAEYHFRKSLERDPAYGRAHTYLGNTLYKADRISEAVQCWVTAIRVEPGSAAAQAAQEKIDRLTFHQKQQMQDVIDKLEQ